MHDDCQNDNFRLGGKVSIESNIEEQDHGQT